MVRTIEINVFKKCEGMKVVSKEVPARKVAGSKLSASKDFSQQHRVKKSALPFISCVTWQMWVPTSMRSRKGTPLKTGFDRSLI